MSIEKTTRHLILGALFAALALMLSVSTQAATKSSNSVPINIQSDNANFDQKTGVSVYTGDVHLIRAGLTLTGKKLVVTNMNKKNRIKAVLTGDPSHIHKVPDADDNKVITGHAQKITYANNNNTITLSGDAVVIRDGDKVIAPVITYNTKTGVTHAQGNKGSGHRVHITLTPSDDTKK